ncbi:MAG: exodeoxyribonuclease VII large subunit [Bacillus sp. (in: Bacteria)]|nr:exodeoxyribonuclease VII large subunit [Bacillus sp. (in: firmicutes)]
MNQQFMSVTDVTRQIKRIIEGDQKLQNVWLRAEISNFKQHSRGHMYFTLKDDHSRINAVMFAGNNRFLKFAPENGMSVLVRGDISVYEPHGQYQLYVKEMQPDGIGNLYLAFEQLKKKLEMAGYFSEYKKKPIPAIPDSIAVVTSPTGAAVRDIITTIKRRFPIAKITLLPVLVQGPNAPYSIARAIQQANMANTFDVMIVGRGGGSLEELWAFNEEVVAEAIYASKIPVISAVGHETDTTISDFVADLRAATPTAAAELAVPDLNEMLKTLKRQRERLIWAMDRLKKVEIDRLNYLTRSYAFRYPKNLIEQKEQDLDRLVDSMNKAVAFQLNSMKSKLAELQSRTRRLHPKNRVDLEKTKLMQVNSLLLRNMERQYRFHDSSFSMLLSKLQVLSPLKVMERGYSLVYDDNKKLIKSVKDVTSKSGITVRMQDGKVFCTVNKYEEMEVPQVNGRDNNGK